MKNAISTIAKNLCMFRDMEDIKFYDSYSANTPLEKANMDLYNLSNLLTLSKPIGRGFIIGAGATAINSLLGGDNSLETYSLGMKIGATVEAAQYMTRMAIQYLKND